MDPKAFFARLRASSPLTRRRWIGLVACAIVSSGCSPIVIQGESGTAHYVVLGFGIVSVPGQAEETAVNAVRIQSVGLTVSNQPQAKFSLGYLSSSTVAIPADTDGVLVEVSQELGGPLIVRAPSDDVRSGPEE